MKECQPTGPAKSDMKGRFIYVLCVYTYICTHTQYTHRYIHLYMYIYRYMHAYMCINTHVCIF